MMTIGDIIIISVLVLVVGYILMSMIQDKKSGKKGCSGCPNYGNCRAHIGCSNNTSTEK